MPARSTVVIKESFLMNKIVLIDESLCIGCAKCVELCPRKILYIDNASKKCKVSNETKCDKLAGCQRVCPVKAIKIMKDIQHNVQ